MKELKKLTIGEAQRIKGLIVANIDGGVNDKLTYAAKRLISNIDKACKPHFDELGEVVADLQINHALTDAETGVLIVEQTEKGERYKYTAPQLITLNKAIRAEQKRVEAIKISFETYISTACPRMSELDILFVEELTGILFEQELLKSLEPTA
jgi:hypothetical protein